MDHIEKPDLDPLPHLRIPYIIWKDHEYDGKGFLEFPESNYLGPFIGVIQARTPELADQDWGQWTPDAVRHILSLIQSWAYFGLLVEFFAILGIQIDHCDFIAVEKNGARSVTSQKLYPLTRLWEVRSRALTFETEQRHYMTAWKYLQAVENLVGALMDPNFRRRTPQFFELLVPGHDTSLAELLLLSIDILAETLSGAAGVLMASSNAIPRPYHASNSTIIRRRLLRTGWCPSEVADLYDQRMKSTFLYHLSLFDREVRAQAHKVCTTKRCVLEDLDQDKYKTRHTRDCEGCSTIVFEDSSTRQISAIVREGGLPLVTVEGSQFREARHSTDKTLVTVSIAQQPQAAHLTSEKDLSQSQQNYAEFLVPKDVSLSQNEIQRYVCISHVWADLGNININGLPNCQLRRVQALVDALYPQESVSIPFWIDTICVPREYPERTMAISMMRDIYAKADRVLVLDSFLLAGEEDPKPLDMLMRIRTSTWSRRLWTFHEGALNQELYYQFPQSAYSAYQITNNFKKRRCACEDTLQLQNKDKSMKAVWDTSAWYPWLGLDAQAAQRRKICLRVDSLDPLLRSAETFVVEIQIVILSTPKQDYRRLAALSGPLRWRRTSREADEPICLAGLLQRDTRDLVNLSATQKMQRLISTLDSVPTGLLFVHGSRIQEEGARWIPASFLGGGFHAAIHAESGRAVPTTDGLLVSLYAITISAQVGFQHMEIEQGNDCIFVSADGTPYKIGSDLQSGPGVNIPWSEYSNTELAVLLSHHIYVEERWVVRGALVSIKRVQDDTIFCRHEHVVNIQKDWFVGAIIDHSKIAVIQAEYTGTEKAWCVG